MMIIKKNVITWLQILFSFMYRLYFYILASIVYNIKLLGTLFPWRQTSKSTEVYGALVNDRGYWTKANVINC